MGLDMEQKFNIKKAGNFYKILHSVIKVPSPSELMLNSCPQDATWGRAFHKTLQASHWVGN